MFTPSQQATLTLLAFFAGIQIVLYLLTAIKGFLVYRSANSQSEDKMVEIKKSSGRYLMKTGLIIASLSSLILTLFIFLLFG